MRNLGLRVAAIALVVTAMAAVPQVAPYAVTVDSAHRLIVTSGSKGGALDADRAFLQLAVVAEAPQSPDSYSKEIPALLAAPASGTLSSVSDQDLRKAIETLKLVGIPGDEIRASITHVLAGNVDVGRILIALHSNDGIELERVLHQVAAAQKVLDPQARDCGGFVCGVATANWWRYAKLRIANVVVVSAECNEKAQIAREAERVAQENAGDIARAIRVTVGRIDSKIGIETRSSRVAFACGNEELQFPAEADPDLQTIALGLRAGKRSMATVAAFASAAASFTGIPMVSRVPIPQLIASDGMQPRENVTLAPVRIDVHPGVPYVAVFGFFRAVVRPRVWLVVVHSSQPSARPDAIAQILERGGFPPASIWEKGEYLFLRATSASDIQKIQSVVLSVTPYSTGRAIPFLGNCEAIGTAVATNAYQSASARAQTAARAAGLAAGQLVALKDAGESHDALCSAGKGDGVAVMQEEAAKYDPNDLLIRSGNLKFQGGWWVGPDAQFSRGFLAYWTLSGNWGAASSSPSDVQGFATIAIGGEQQCDAAVLSSLRDSVRDAMRRLQGPVQAIIEKDEQVEDRGLCTLANQYAPQTTVLDFPNWRHSVPAVKVTVLLR